MPSPLRSVLTVIDNVPFGGDNQRRFCALTLQRPAWEKWTPGQFIMLRPLNWTADLIWARPFSISKVTADSLVIFFQVVGRGTNRLAELHSGDEVLIWGPLGTGFRIEPRRPTLMLAGGIGIAPFAGYVREHPAPENLKLLFGHRLSLSNYPADSLGQQVELESFHEQNSEDLAKWQELVKSNMRNFKQRDGLALACGPMPFLKMIWRYALELDLPTQLSLEQRMACGIGACLGCVAGTSEYWPDKAKAGLPVQTCTKGPVFWAKELDLDSVINAN